MKAHNTLSHLRELLACETLRKEGYTIVLRGYTGARGRRVIVARENDWLIFVDVTSTARKYTPEDQERFRNIARRYVIEHPTARAGVRFDNVVVRLYANTPALVTVNQHVFYQGKI